MTDFVDDLERRLHETASAISTSSELAAVTLRRARRRRLSTAVSAVAAAGVIGVAIFSLVAALPFGGDRRDHPISPASTVPANQAERLGSRPCAYGRAVRAEIPGNPKNGRPARCAWHATGDVDGDGEIDDVYSFGTSRGPTKTDPKWLRSNWYLFVELADGSVFRPFPSEMKLGMPVTPQLVGTADADSDGASEIFLASDIGNGATVSIWAFDDRDVHEVHEPPRPFEFNVTGSVNYRAGVTCSDVDADGTAELVVSEAQATENGDFATSRSTYEWLDQSTVGQSDFASATIPPEDPSLAEYGSLDCEGLRWSPG